MVLDLVLAQDNPARQATIADMSDPDEFRKQGEECRQLAGTAIKPVDKAFWLRLAEDWLKLAQDADKPSKRR